MNMDARTACYVVAAASAGYIILTLVRPIIVGGRLRITIPWRVPCIGETAVFRRDGKRIIATVIATGGDLLLPDRTICRLPPDGNPVADIMYELLARHPDVEEVPVGCIYIQRRGITAIVPLSTRVGAILI